MDEKALFEIAERARERAYSPYSRYTVGAALLCADGTVITGVNVENASFGATNCAERSAVFAAVSGGYRDFAAIAIAGGRAGERSGDCTPCGICRQVLSEFCAPDLPVILKSGTYTLGALLPHGFTEDQL